MSGVSGRLPPKAVLVAAVAVVAGGVAVALVLQPSASDLEDAFAGGGTLGPILYAALYAALTVAFVPGLPLTLAAGALYGAVGGAAVSVVGATAGATGAFIVSRRSTRGSVERVRGARLLSIEERLSGKGLVALLALRLIPVVPFNALNYAAGASSIGARDYVIATAFGIVPGAVVFAALGAGLDDPASPLFVGSAVLAIALALAARHVSRRAGDDEGASREADALPAREAGASPAREAGASPARGGPAAALPAAELSPPLRPELKRLAWAAGFFVAALAIFAGLFVAGLFH